jgi:hypothetical protein
VLTERKEEVRKERKHIDGKKKIKEERDRRNRHENSLLQ